MGRSRVIAAIPRRFYTLRNNNKQINQSKQSSRADATTTGRSSSPPSSPASPAPSINSPVPRPFSSFSSSSCYWCGGGLPRRRQRRRRASRCCRPISRCGARGRRRLRGCTHQGSWRGRGADRRGRWGVRWGRMGSIVAWIRYRSRIDRIDLELIEVLELLINYKVQAVAVP